jgi:hypothetical protein
VIAVLIRGGVFGDPEKKDEKDKETSQGDTTGDVD